MVIPHNDEKSKEIRKTLEGIISSYQFISSRMFSFIKISSRPKNVGSRWARNIFGSKTWPQRSWGHVLKAQDRQSKLGGQWSVVSVVSGSVWSVWLRKFCFSHWVFEPVKEARYLGSVPSGKLKFWWEKMKADLGWEKGFWMQRNRLGTLGCP